MAEFVTIMKQWHRMCAYMRERRMCTLSGCSLYENSVCEEIYVNIDGAPDYAEVERVIMDWTKEHPAPVYPTWSEWLESITHQMVDGDLLDSTIPDDIAEKLGVKAVGESE